MEKEKNPFAGSLCMTCKHCMRRVIEPIDPDSFMEEYEYITEEEGDEEDDFEFYQVTCMLLNIDLDHVVLECNKYEPENMTALIENESVKIWSL